MRKPVHSFANRLIQRILLLWILMMSAVAVVVFFQAETGMARLSDVHYNDVLDLTDEKIQGILRSVEISAVNFREGVESNLTGPSSVYVSLEQEMSLNPHLSNCGVAFIPGYYPDEGYLFEPSIRRLKDGSMQRIQLASEQHNYLNSRQYNEAIVADKDYWSEPHFDVSGVKTMLCSYAVPLHDKQGKVIGMLGVEASLDWLTAQLREVDRIVHERDQIPDDAEHQPYSFLLDRDGDYIAHPDTERMLRKSYFDFAGSEADPGDTSYVHIGHAMLAGEKGREKTVIEGVPSYVYYAPVEKTGWSVGIVVPHSAVRRPGILQGLFILGMMLLGMLLIALASRFMIKRTAEPLQFLAQSAKKVAKGDFNTPLPEIRHHDEIRLLRDSFADMQNSLSAYIRELTATTAQKASMESELYIAREIQMSMLPVDFTLSPALKGIDIFASLTPAKAVGGDFYDFLVRDGRLFFCIGDVSGKGVPSALVMSIISTQFRSLSLTENKPEKIVSAINAFSKDRNATMMFATIFVGILDPETGVLSYCNAGHNAPVLTGKEPCFLKVESNIPVGVETEWKYKGQTHTLASGTTMLLYTDGLTEAENDQHDQFGEPRILDVIRNAGSVEPEPMVHELTDAVRRFVGEAEQSDDLTMLAIRLPEKVN